MDLQSSVGQTSLEYLLILVVALFAVAVVFMFLMGTYESASEQGDELFGACQEGEISLSCFCGGVEYSSGYCCGSSGSHYWSSNPCTVLGQCLDGVITAECICEGESRLTGYCCSGMYRISPCVATGCGNGIIEALEACDGLNFKGKTCVDLDPRSYDTISGLSCLNNCGIIDFSSCPYCGDGTCDSEFEDILSCAVDCPSSGCNKDGVKDPGEECDGLDFGGRGCESFGYDSGTLSCDLCIIDKSGCSGGLCTDADEDGYSIDGGDCGEVDCNDGSASINPGANELCDNGVDDNCDGLTDCSDAACAEDPLCVLTVSAEPISTSFEDSITVTLTASDPAATIYYTTDETEPTSESESYTEPLTFTYTTTLTFFAATESLESASVTETYSLEAVNLDLEAVAEVNEPDWGSGNSQWIFRLSPEFGPTEFYAPLPVFFEGWESSPRDAIAEWVWDFGDGSPEFSGFNAAHIYEEPGSYTATLTIRGYNGETDSDSVDITVLERDGDTYYVDSEEGDDGNSGLSPSEAWESIQVVGVGDTILLKRGQDFVYSEPAVLSNGVLITSSSSFADGSGIPVIRPADDSTGFYSQSSNGPNYVIFSDLIFEGPGSENLIYMSGAEKRSHFVFHNCEFRDAERFINTGGTEGLFIMESEMGNSENTMIYTTGARIAIIGNSFSDSGNHIQYSEGAEKMVITDNEYIHAATNRHALRVSGKSNENDPVDNVYIARNYFAGSGSDWMVVHLGPNTAGGGKEVEDIIFEENVIAGGKCLLNLADIERGIVRNNLLLGSSSQSEKGVLLVGSIHGYDSRPCKEIDIVGNTIIFNSGDEAFKIASTSAGSPSDITFSNNIVYDANSGGYFIDNEVSGSLESSNNVYYREGSSSSPSAFRVGSSTYDLEGWQGRGFDEGSQYVDPEFRGDASSEWGYSSFPSLGVFRLSSGSPAIAAGMNALANSYYDYYHDRRGEPPDVGAFES